ncbi:MAG TPA: heme-binding domain-containing protein [Bacteroidales bacterium]
MTKKIVWLSILAALVIIQVIPAGRPEVIEQNKNDLLLNNSIPDTVANLLKNACYDCHSNQTVYPWYSYVAPVSWLVVRDIKVGRKHMNFSNWESLSKTDKAEHLSDINDEVSMGSMPMVIYPIMHPEARLTAEERQMIVDWTDEFGEALFDN